MKAQPGRRSLPPDARSTFASDTDIYVRYTQTGTAATAGAATILIPYFPPNW
jgi:hypothetical protein